MIKSTIPTATKPLQPGTKQVSQETILTPRFYTKDFDTVANLDLSAQENELKAMLAEMRADYNRHHFVRDQEFAQSWEHLTGEARQAFIEILLSSSDISQIS